MKGLLRTIIILAGLVIGFFGIPSVLDSTSAEISARLQSGNEKAITEQLTEIAEASVLEYDYTNAVILEDNDKKIFEKFSIPFSTKQVVMEYKGIVKLGADISKMKVSTSNPFGNAKKVTITLPPIDIMSHELDRSSVKFPIENNSFINKLQNKDYEELEKKGDKEIQKLIKENDILDQAKSELKESMSGYLNGLYDGKVTVEFK